MLVQTRLVDFYVWGSAAVWGVPSHPLGDSFVHCCILAFCITYLFSWLILSFWLSIFFSSFWRKGAWHLECLKILFYSYIWLILWLDTLARSPGCHFYTVLKAWPHCLLATDKSGAILIYTLCVACLFSLKASFCPWIVKFHNAVLWCGTIFIHCARHLFNLETHLLSWETFY